jgi:protein TonB
MHPRLAIFVALASTLIACSVQPAKTETPALAESQAQAQGSKPQLIFKECRSLPDYPIASRQRNETGTVVLSFLVDEGGKVTRSAIKQSSGHELLDQAAMSALSLCPFRPGYRDGQPVAAEAVVQYVWKIQ